MLLQIISNIKKNSENNKGYIPADFEPAEKAQKHKKMQNKDALVVNPFLKPPSIAVPAAKLDSGQAVAEQRPLPDAVVESIISAGGLLYFSI